MNDTNRRYHDAHAPHAPAFLSRSEQRRLDMQPGAIEAVDAIKRERDEGRATIARLSAEVERLRGALTEIVDQIAAAADGAVMRWRSNGSDYNEGWADGASSAADDARALARAALAPQQQADATGGEGTLPDDQAQKLLTVYEAARSMCFGQDWNNGTTAKFHGWRQRLVDAVHAVEPLPDCACRPLPPPPASGTGEKL